MPPRAALSDRLSSWPLGTQTLVVAAVCVLVYWVGLGHSPLAMSEAHRTLPAWEMLQSGHWLVPTLFEQPYLRKPPGIQWIVAVSSWVLGENEFAARLPSALAMTLGSILTLWTAARWWSTRWSMWAGLAHALTPLFWYPGRSAEIESVHNLFVQLAMIGGLEVLLATRGQSGLQQSVRWWSIAMLMAGLCGAVLTKGPAGLPCIAGVMIGAVMAERRLRVLANGRWWMSLGMSGAFVALVSWLIQRDVNARGLTPVLQSPAGFLWDTRKLLDILLLPIIGLLTAAPASLAFPWLLRRTGEGQAHARAIFWSVVGALCLYSWIGISNPRYAMPVLGVVPLAVTWFLQVAEARSGHSKLARVGVRAVPVVGALLVLAALVNVWHSETRRDRISGRDAGVALARLIPDGATIWANQVLEYRPEVLWYGMRSAEAEGRSQRYLWMPGAGAGKEGVPPAGTYLLLLSPRDPAVSVARFEKALPAWERLGEAVVHKYKVELWRVPQEAVPHTLGP